MVRIMLPIVVLLIVISSHLNSAFEVLDLTNDNFYQEIMSSQNAILVAFDGPKHLSESSSSKLFEELGEKLESFGIRAGHVDCSNDSPNRKICTAASLRTIPTYQLFLDEPNKNPYTKKLIRTPIVHTGRTNTVKAIEGFVTKAYSSYISPISLVEHYNEYKQNTTIPLAVFCTKNGGSNIPMLLKSIAYYFKKKIKFLHIQEDATDLMALLSFDSCPALVIRVKGEEETKIRRYDGTSLKDAAEVKTWLSAFVPVENIERTQGGEEAADNNIISSWKTMEEILTIKDLDSTIIITVVKASASAELDTSVLQKINKLGEGVVRNIEFRCGTEIQSDETQTASLICSTFAKDSKPFLLSVPYGAKLRSKLKTSLTKFISDIDSTDSAKQIALDSLPDNIFPISPESMNFFLSQAVEKKLMAVLVLSEKPNPPLMLRNLAHLLRKIAIIGFFHNPPAEVMANFGNPPPPVPSVIAMFNNDKESDAESTGFQINVFNPKLFGAIKFDSLRDFLLQTYSATGFNDNDGKYFDETSSTSGSVDIDIAEVESEEEWNTACGSDFRGICAIAFFNGNDTAIAKDLSNKFLNAAKGIGKNAAAFKFITINAICQTSFADTFDVQEGKLPTIVAYSPSKDRYALLKSSFADSTGIKDFLLSVVTGKYATQPMSLRPKLLPQCDIQEVITELLPSEDAADFLEEIRKEEEEKAKQIKTELEEDRKRAEEDKKKSAADDKKKKKKKSKKSKKSKGGEEL